MFQISNEMMRHFINFMKIYIVLVVVIEINIMVMWKVNTKGCINNLIHYY